jgi:Zn-dependent membrane protease YugP
MMGGVIAVLIFVLLWAAVTLLLWVVARRTIARHDVPREGLPTGEAVARRIMRDHELPSVKVERGDADCYRATARTIQLAGGHFSRGSVSAMAIAAHESAHTLQHAASWRPWQVWWVLSGWAVVANVALLVVIPLGLFVGWPALIWVAIVLILIALVAGAFSGNVESDAVRLAMLELNKESAMQAAELTAARRVLRAAATVYIVETIFDVGLLARWFSRGDDLDGSQRDGNDFAGDGLGTGGGNDGR